MNSLHNYALITAAYWAFTVTDGALRMLVILYFHQLGFSAFDIAVLFVLYELCGVFTNLLGGWLGSRLGLQWLMRAGLLLQILALLMLSVPTSWLEVSYVMAVQALSGVAKDLNKMSAKSSVKKLVPKEANAQLLRWVALLTGSKNTLKGVGFFVGALLLGIFGFKGAVWVLAILLVVALLGTLFITTEFRRAKKQQPFKTLLAKSSAINYLSLARFFLFGARDIWFVVALPVFLVENGWRFDGIGAFMALWVVVYGIVQMLAPRLLGAQQGRGLLSHWSFLLLAVLMIMMLSVMAGLDEHATLIIGLLVFGVVFAINSSLHSYLVLYYSDNDNTTADVGFYYMANAGGRLVGTLLSGALYQWSGMQGCLWWAAVFVLCTAVVSLVLEDKESSQLKISL